MPVAPEQQDEASPLLTAIPEKQKWLCYDYDERVQGREGEGLEEEQEEIHSRGFVGKVKKNNAYGRIEVLSKKKKKKKDKSNDHSNDKIIRKKNNKKKESGGYDRNNIVRISKSGGRGESSSSSGGRYTSDDCDYDYDYSSLEEDDHEDKGEPDGNREVTEREEGRSLSTILIAVALGQLMALLVAGSGVTAKLLSLHYDLDIPTTQSATVYVLLFVVYGPFYLHQVSRQCKYSEYTEIPGRGYILHGEGQDQSTHLGVLGMVKKAFRERGLGYLALAICDVEANYLVVKAYQFTTFTSVQILDCFSIPCVLLISIVAFKARYIGTHYLGVAVCVFGIFSLLISDCSQKDIFGGGGNLPSDDPPQSPAAKNPLLGDVLCLCGALLYAISNSGQEYFVKNVHRLEMLTFVGLFGSLVSACQAAVLEYKVLSEMQMNVDMGLLLGGFALCLFVMYSCVPFLLARSNATMMNLSLLASDVYSVVLGIFIFHYSFSLLYIGSILLIVFGLMIYNSSAVSMDVHREQTVSDRHEDTEEIDTSGSFPICFDGATDSSTPA
eukprot:Nk52_evm23s62 gene=Nk52_evmTU23s62